MAAALGISEHAARKRLTRATERLRRFFAARGVAAAPALLLAALTPDTTVPPALAQGVTRAAMAPSSDRLLVARAVGRAMGRRKVFSAAPALLAVLLVVAGGAAALLATSARRAHATAPATVIEPPVRPARPGLRLTIPWSGRFYTVPMPATFPRELLDTDSYRAWKSAGDPRTFQWATRDGRRYVARASLRQENGRRFAFISRVQLFRADGTLETETINDDRGEPRQWIVYAQDGKTPQAALTDCPPGMPGAPFVQSVRLFNSDGTSREYDAERTGIVYAEWLLDVSGKKVRLLNASGKQSR